MKDPNTAREESLSGQLESESIAKTINSIFIVVEFEPTGNILNVNQNFTDLMGYTLSEVKKLHHGMLVEPEVRLSDDYSQFWNNLANGAEQKGKFKRINKHGEPVWINGNYMPMRNKAGEVVKIVKIAIDVTDTTKKEMRLTDEIEQLKKRLGTAKDNKVERVIGQLGNNPLSLQHKKMGFSEHRVDPKDTASFIVDEKNNKLILPSSDGLTFVKVSDIIYCEADSNYTIFFMMDGKKIMVSQTLKEYEQLLNPHRFFRIHHSYLININMIKQYIRGEGGQVVMLDGTILDVAKRRKEEFLNLFSSKSSFV
jgi:PAS domain S-box-containing protein